MNKKIFDGLLPANQEAENTSKKERCETFVVKENIGGLRYVMYKTRHNLPENAKLLSIYSNGDKLSSMPEKPDVAQRPVQIQRPVEAQKPTQETVVKLNDVTEVAPTKTDEGAEVKIEKQEE